MDVNSIDVCDIANWFLNKEPMNTKKLNKLCYYTVSWHYVIYDQKLDFDFYAKNTGPVSKKIITKYPPSSIPYSSNIKLPFDKYFEDFLESIYDTYGYYSAHDLMEKTCAEEPWIRDRKNLKPYEINEYLMDYEYIQKYYKSKLMLITKVDDE